MIRLGLLFAALVASPALAQADNKAKDIEVPIGAIPLDDARECLAYRVFITSLARNAARRGADKELDQEVEAVAFGLGNRWYRYVIFSTGQSHDEITNRVLTRITQFSQRLDQADTFFPEFDGLENMCADYEMSSLPESPTDPE